MFAVRYKELFTLYIVMSVGYDELFKCKVSIISVFSFYYSTYKCNKKDVSRSTQTDYYHK